MHCRRTVAVLALFLGFLACGGHAAAPVDGPTATVTIPTYCGRADSPAARALFTCPSHDSVEPPVACSTNADCVAAPGGRTCRGSVCTFDDCITDADCPSGTACVCASVRGRLYSANACLPSGCRTNADCGADGVCAASLSPECSVFGQYACRTAADTCRTGADCCSSQPSNGCTYQPELGHFACESATGCPPG